MQDKENNVNNIIEENKDNFDDIILEKTEQSEKTKKMLFRIIALIILFLAIIIVMKIINTDDTQESSSVTQQVPINVIVPDKFDELKEESEELNEEEKIQQFIQSQIKQEQQDQNETNEIVSKTEPKQEIKDIFENVNISSQEKTQNNTGFYIQVASVSKFNEDSKELKNIKSKGYDYKTHKVSINGKESIKILIGPYQNRAQANAELPKIKQELNKDAYIYEIK